GSPFNRVDVDRSQIALDGRPESRFLKRDGDEPAGAEVPSELRQVVGLLSRIAGAAGRDNRLDLAPFGEDVLKDGQLQSRKEIADVRELHPEAGIRFVHTVAGHCLSVGEARERHRQLYADADLEEIGYHPLAQIEDLIDR